jgi:hypothetical protein
MLIQLNVAQIFSGMIEGLRGTGINNTAIARAAEVPEATISHYARGDASRVALSPTSNCRRERYAGFAFGHTAPISLRQQKSAQRP